MTRQEIRSSGKTPQPAPEDGETGVGEALARAGPTTMAMEKDRMGCGLPPLAVRGQVRGWRARRVLEAVVQDEHWPCMEKAADSIPPSET